MARFHQPLLRMRSRASALAALGLWMMLPPSPAQPAESESRRASLPLQVEKASSAPVEVVLRWQPASISADNIATTVYRRAFPPKRAGWGEPLAVLAPGETRFRDTAAAPGQFHEYRIVSVETAGGRTAYGYAVVALDPPPADLDAGKTILVLVTEDLARSPQARRFEETLGNLGYQVITKPVAPTATPWEIREIAARCRVDIGPTLSAIQILGKVPAPYSGNFAPDGHRDHWGAWPTDLYYAELNGSWTDERVNNVSSGDARQHNIPGDGKLDQNELPGAIEVSIGRVDFTRVFAGDDSIPEPVKEDLRSRKMAAWLDRMTRWQQARGPVFPAEVLLHDRLAENPEAFATTPWRVASLLTPGGAPPTETALLPSLRDRDALMAFGYAPGVINAALGVVNTIDLERTPLRAPLLFLFGSYFGDWDAPGNLLASALAGADETQVLATAWAARPPWQLHPLVAGFTLGDCQVLTANHTPDYLPGLREAYPIHLELLGAPTLDLYPLPCPPRPVAEVNGAEVELTWNPAVQVEPARPPMLNATPLGWHVYAMSELSPPLRLTANPLPSDATAFQYRFAELKGRLAPLAPPLDKLVLQVRMLYRLETPIGAFQKLGPGEKVRIKH